MSKVKLKYALLVIAAIVVSAEMFLPAYVGHVDTKYGRAKSDIEIVAEALKLYFNDNGTYPSNDEGLSVLSASEADKYLDRIPKDPWGNQYLYKYPGSHNTAGYDLWSYGQDGVLGGKMGDQDITNW